MPVGATIGVGVIGAVGSYMSANSARNSAEDAANKQQRLQQQQIDLQNKIYADQEAAYKPVRDKLIGEVQSDLPPDWGLTKGQIDKNYQDAGKATDEALGREGNATNSGLGASMSQGLTLEKAKEMSNAWLTGQKTKRQMALGLLGHDQTVNAGEAAAGGIQNASGMEANLAARYGLMAQQGYAGIGSAVGTGATLYGLKQNPGTTPTDPNAPAPEWINNPAISPAVLSPTGAGANVPSGDWVNEATAGGQPWWLSGPSGGTDSGWGG